ncbi:hypothetical protein Tco_0648884 [Tanacetum coccineum]
MEVFREIFQMCPNLLNQEFDALPSDEEIVSFIKELGHKGDIKSVTEVVIDHMYQPWRTFAAIINKCFSGKITGLDKLRLSRAQILWGMFYKKNVDFVSLLWVDFTFKIENRDHKKQEKMYYPKFTKAIIHHFITKDKSISMRNRMFMHTARDDNILGPMRFVSKSDDFQVYGSLLTNRITNQQMRDSDAYKTYLVYATGAASPKMKRKFKKPAYPSKKRTLVTVKEEGPELAKKDKPKKAPAKAKRSKGIELLSDAALFEEAQFKRALKRRKLETNIHQAGDLRVSDVSKGDSSESEYESWGDSRDEDVDDQQGDDERTKSDNEQTETDNPKTSDDEEEIQDDEFVHTPEDYVPTDDETNDESNDVTEEEYERINEELYGDVNVSLTDVEPTKKEKDDKEMTIAGHVNVNQEGAGNQVKDDAQATQKTNALIPSSSISSDYAAKFLNFDNIPPTDTKVISMMDINVQHEVPPLTTEALTSTIVVPDSETLAAFQLRVTDLEKDVKELKDVDNSIKVISTIQSEVPKAVKEYLRSSLDDAMYKVIQRNFADIVKEHSVPAKIVERVRHQYAPQKSIEDIQEIKMEHARKQQVPKETITSSDTTTLEEFDQKTTLFETMTKFKSFNKTLKQRALYHAFIESILEEEDAMDKRVADKLKKRKPNDRLKIRPFWPHNLEEDTGNTDVPHVVNVDPNDWFKKPERPPTPDPEWNKSKSAENKPTQNWLSDLAKAEKPSRTFDDLMSTPIDFNAFVMNRLQISKLTQDILVGLAYNILKGTYRSYVELDYNMEEC